MKTRLTRTALPLSALALLLFAAAARGQTEGRTKAEEVNGLDAAALVRDAHFNGARMAGVVWIDAAERVVLRLEAWPATGRDLKDGANSDEPAVVYEEVKVGEGLWMRGLSRIDTTRNPAFFDGVHVYFNGVFGHYRRFGTEFDSYKLAAPKAQD